ncbi:hypothetical protein [Estrella lausannensis]|uniref:Putative secreted protein n=1 Tax=Estrella lausannensis TaxID=483423 RepID=A0A0H5DNT2_9BACT|nr:hypothetical protein [Estrella lausannensis]CRX37483.1 Putative secreted protein [Estrella lausannensis]
MKSILHLLLVLACLVSSGSSSADAYYDTYGILHTVDEVIIGIREGDLYEVYSSLTTPNFKNCMCFSDFLLFLSNVPALRENKTVRMGVTKANETRGVYEGEIGSKEGEKMAIHIDLVRNRKKWLVESIVAYPLYKNDARY